MKKILAIVGSLRKESFNLQLAKEAEIALNNRVEFEILDYLDIPYMNQDIEFPAPDSVYKIRQKVKKCDAIWFFTPEYNPEAVSPNIIPTKIAVLKSCG